MTLPSAGTEFCDECDTYIPRAPGTTEPPGFAREDRWLGHEAGALIRS